jgi:hypothetical protein
MAAGGTFLQMKADFQVPEKLKASEDEFYPDPGLIHFLIPAADNLSLIAPSHPCASGL